MSDDLRDTFGEDIFSEPDEEFEEEEGEGQNRTFLIAVAVLGGLLFFAIAAFIVWAAVLNPRMQAQQAEQNGEISATNEAIMVAMNSTATAEAMGAEEQTVEATEEVPEPTATATPVIKATNTPTATPETTVEGETTGEEASAEGTVTGEEATETAQTPRRTPTTVPTATPTRTPRPTPTRTRATSTSETDETPDTGLGEVLLIIAAGLLVTVIVSARKLRKAR